LIRSAQANGASPHAERTVLYRKTTDMTALALRAAILFSCVLIDDN